MPGARAVDEVDRVDGDGLDRRVGERPPKRRVVVGPVGGRPPGAGAPVEDLDRLAVALDSALHGLGESTRCGNMRADQHR